MDLEFVDDAPATPENPDDVVSGTAGRVPPWFVGLVVAAVVAIAVVVIAHRNSDDPPRQAAGPTAGPTSTPSTPAPSPPNAVDETIQTVYLRGRDVGRAYDTILGGSDGGTCTKVRIGDMPQHAAALALKRQFPGYRIIDRARTIDQSTGLCSLQVRAHDDNGNVALLIVTSPTRGMATGRRQALEANDQRFSSLYVEYARFTSHDGWRVLIGVSGPKDDLPSPRALGDLAVDPSLRW